MGSRGVTVVSENIKQKQLDIILKTNPAEDDIHTWIRSVDDILSYQEAIDDIGGPTWLTDDFTEDMIKEALRTNEITVYSSKPIKNGNFVTPSYMEAEQYAGGIGGKVYSKKVKLNHVAWIDELQGQYAKV